MAVLVAAGVALAEEAQTVVPTGVKGAEQGAEPANGPVVKAGKPGAKKPAAVGRESVITASKIEFDNKEGVILFDENVLVDDEQFLMRADRLLVFMEGTNDVQQLMAVGRVNISNENRVASCEKAVYTKKDGQIVMTGNARLIQSGGDKGEVTGDRIVIWVDDQRMEVYPGRVVLPPGSLNKGDRKLLP
jgi:lipopolysaccharide transport protein LptA